ncbi:M20/M25/M40 family metallo-hydrolase [Dyadobacter tibetensis]|uniref:M20/M25/M40 family metallo-hydrolase n=1 Tax=Dyadobacter tibetensis TaxID=1211851 RepID=UPI00047044F7|nr:M20/M25/M40 family metallo-hydrolase [Dyadobacter tibetensis]
MRITLLLGLLTISLMSTAQSIQPSPSELTKHITYLASDAMKGRGTGSKQNDQAAKYVAKQFKKYGLKPMGTKVYEQEFIAKVKRVVVKDSIRQAKNIIGFLDNGAEYTIIVGAHFDHLGEGRQGGSKAEKPEGKIHNGADDNASGVAGMLEIARYFSGNKVREAYNFLFIGFGAEELGLLGSKHFVNNPTIPLATVNFMTNMDMIGRYNPDRGVGIGGYGTSSQWPQVFDGIKGTVRFFTDKAGSGGSDHGSFYAKSIPVLFFHTGGHDDYHQPTDDIEKVDVVSEAEILKIHLQLIEKAMSFPKLDFSEVAS